MLFGGFGGFWYQPTIRDAQRSKAVKANRLTAR